MNVALYELAAEFRQTAELLADMDLDEDTIRDTIEAAAFPVEQKAVPVAAFVRNLEAHPVRDNRKNKNAAPQSYAAPQQNSGGGFGDFQDDVPF